MSIAVISTGTELLKGTTLNTNLAFLGRELNSIGLAIRLALTAGDHERDLYAAYSEALDCADTLIVSGGLGPTRDDITLDATARFFGLELAPHPELVEKGTNFWGLRHRGRVPKPVLRQARAPEGATLLPNPNGSATGDPEFHNNMPHMASPFADRGDGTGPYAVYYTLYEAVARGLIEDDPMSTDWESSKGRINSGEIATMVLGSWAVQQFKDAGPNPDDISYMPFPITVDGKRYAGAGGNYSYGINNKVSADNQIAAMLYVKWLLDESSIFIDEGCIPARKDGEMPAFLADFEGVELVSNNPPPEGEEDLFDQVNLQSEVGINNDDYPECALLEAALTGSQTLDEIMAERDAAWNSAQEILGVEVTM